MGRVDPGEGVTDYLGAGRSGGGVKDYLGADDDRGRG